MASGAERRVEPRRELFTQLTVVVQGREIKGRTFDVSLSGIGAYLDEACPSGAACVIHFALRNKSGAPISIRAPGEIRYSVLASDGRGYRTGIHFGMLDIPELGSILQYLDAKQASPWRREDH